MVWKLKTNKVGDIMDFLKLVTKYINYDIDSLQLMYELKHIDDSDFEEDEKEFIESLHTIINYVTDKYKADTVSLDEINEVQKSYENEMLINKLKDYRLSKFKDNDKYKKEIERIENTKIIINSHKAFENKKTHFTILYYLLSNKIIYAYINNLDVIEKLELIEKNYNYAYGIIEKEELDELISICIEDNDKEVLMNLFYLYLRLCNDFSKEIIDYFIDVEEDIYLGSLLSIFYLINKNENDLNIIKMYISTKNEELGNKTDKIYDEIMSLEE